MNSDSYLLQKYQENEKFKAQIDRAYMKYHQLRSQADQYDLSSISDQIFAKFPHEKIDIFFYYALLQDVSEEQLFKLTMYFLKNFNLKPCRPFVFVFFNNQAHFDAYGQLRTIFLLLTLDHFNFLDYFIVVRPSFYHKAFDYLSYDTIPKYLKSKTVYKNSGSDLCSMLHIEPQDFVDFVPTLISQKQFPQLKPRQIKIEEQRINFEGQRRNEDEKIVQNKFQESIKSFLFVKPGKQTHNLSDYEINRFGVPVVLEVLVYYFQTHADGLELEGLFRKSVSIDDENQLLLKIAEKDYDCLLEVENPHLIANLIKRFFSNLRVPVIPFDLFQELMHDQGVKNKKDNLKSIIDRLPDINYRSLLFLLIFLKDYVIAKEQKNKMSSKNVGICFSPCLMRSQKPSQADLLYASKGATITQSLIEELQFLFGSSQKQNSVFLEKENEHKRQFQETLEIKIQAEKVKLQQSQEYERNSQKRQSQREKQQVRQHENEKKQLSVIKEERNREESLTIEDLQRKQRESKERAEELKKQQINNHQQREREREKQKEQEQNFFVMNPSNNENHHSLPTDFKYKEVKLMKFESDIEAPELKIEQNKKVEVEKNKYPAIDEEENKYPEIDHTYEQEAENIVVKEDNSEKSLQSIHSDT